MSKKILLLLIAVSVSTLSMTVPKTAFAEEPTQSVWTLEKMAAFKAEVDAEDDLICAGDWMCKEDLRLGRLEGDEGRIYRALEEFNMSSFIISSINPSSETISLYFQDEDWMMGMMGMDESRKLTEVYAFWLEDGMIGPAKDTIDIYNYSGDVKDGIFVDGLHPLISKNEEKDGVDWFPFRTEMQFSVEGSDLVSNREGIIYFTVNANGLIIGLKDYSECINSPDYVEGMECRIMFSDSGLRYMPFSSGAANLLADNPVSDLEPYPIEEQLGFGNANTNTNTDTDTDTNVSANVDVDTDDKTVSTVTGHNIVGSGIKAPDTGAYTYPAEACSKEINMPWWLIVAILAGNALLIWWFMPSRQKSAKKCQKSLDNPNIF